MHKAASTFVADVLINSLARRTAAYDLYHVGSFLIRYLQQQQNEKGLVPAGSPVERQAQLEQFLQDQPLPTSNTLVGRLYPGHMASIEKVLQHSVPDDNNWLLAMRRDPRDAMISLYYSISWSHNLQGVEGDNSQFMQNRQNLRKQDVRNGLKWLLNARGVDSTIPEFLHITDLILANDRVCDLSYEMLINDPHLWLAKFVEFTEVDEFVDDEWMSEMAAHVTPPEVEDPKSHKRRVKPGNWVDVFDDELEHMVKDKLGNRLEQFGYAW